MAQKINPCTLTGLENAGQLNMVTLNSTTDSAVITSNMTDCDGRMLVFITIPDVNANFWITFLRGGLANEDKVYHKISLSTNATNVVPFYTGECIGENGTGAFKIITDSTGTIASLGITVGLIKQRIVPNY